MSGATEEEWGVYVHVPWCRRRCPYCPFYVEVDRGVPWDAFVDRVLTEHAQCRHAFPGAPTTVSLGGGTPSRMPAPPLQRLLGELITSTTREVTCEVNPEDLDPGWLDAALESGVTRLSLGVQTLDEAHARLLDRPCGAEHARQQAHRVARAGFQSWSIDIIFALPGQTLAQLDADLDRLLELEPPHVTLYGLTFEEGTPFHQAHALGRLHAPDEDLWREMYDLLVKRLEEAGLHRYEVCNFARPGHRSLHNQSYWTDRSYMGLGPSAHGYAPDGTRWVNVRDVDRYLARPDPTQTRERPSPAEAAADLVLSMLRSVEGLDLDHLANRTGHELPEDAWGPLARRGLLHRSGSRLALTSAGFPVADAISTRLVSHLTPAQPARFPRAPAHR